MTQIEGMQSFMLSDINTPPFSRKKLNVLVLWPLLLIE